MLSEFKQLSDSAKIWIYQADRALDLDEVQLVEDRIRAFLLTWKSHGDEIKVALQIEKNQFLIIAVDEDFNQISGCSIDASVREIQQLGKDLKVDFLNKLNIAYLNDGLVQTVSIPKFKQLIAEGIINQNTVVFNTMVSTIGAFNQQWQIAAKHSWMSKYFKKEASL